MKIFNNGTEYEVDIQELLKTGYVPGWLVTILFSMLFFMVMMTLICYKYCTKCTEGFKNSSMDCSIGCKNVCTCTSGCLEACSYNCGLFVNSYKTCVDKTHDCVTYRPNMNRADDFWVNNRAEGERIFTNVPRRNMPVVRDGPNPFDHC